MMNELQGNKIIAKFMGMVFTSTSIDSYNFEQYEYRLPDDLSLQVYGYNGATIFLDDQFSKSWEWIMPVVLKIELIRGFEVVIEKDICTIKDNFFDKRIDKPFTAANICNNENVPRKLCGLYKVILEFILWYNNQPSQP